MVYAAGIVAEIGQIERFENEAQLAKYCGLYWKKNQSRNFESERTPMTRTGNQYLRYYMVEAANSIRRHEESYRRYYQKNMMKFRNLNTNEPPPLPLENFYVW